MSEYKLDQTFVHKTATHEFFIHWMRLGKTSSPPLVFIHGTPWSSFVWRDLALSLSSRYSVYLFDHPGFGSSPSCRRLVDITDGDQDDLDASLTLRAEVNAALFRHWDLTSPPHVVAHDNGGLVALRLLLQHSVKFASLCLIDVVALGPFGLPIFKLVAENEGVFRELPNVFLEGFVRAYVNSAVYTPLSKDIEDTLVAPWLAGGSQGPERFLKEMIQAHYRNVGDLESHYGSVGGRLPVKIVWGRDDAWLPVETATRLKNTLKADEITVIDRAGHLVQFDQPSRLVMEVGLWLEKHN